MWVASACWVKTVTGKNHRNYGMTPQSANIYNPDKLPKLTGKSAIYSLFLSLKVKKANREQSSRPLPPLGGSFVVVKINVIYLCIINKAGCTMLATSSVH